MHLLQESSHALIFMQNCPSLKMLFDGVWKAVTETPVTLSSELQPGAWMHLKKSLPAMGQAFCISLFPGQQESAGHNDPALNRDRQIAHTWGLCQFSLSYVWKSGKGKCCKVMDQVVKGLFRIFYFTI